MIKGGYILQPRKIDESDIQECPPHVREIWLYLLRKANHKDTPNKKLQKGQLLTSYKKIINDLSWKVGYRTENYKKHHCETAMKVLTRLNMITTTKTTRGIIVTICNYEYYQNPKNYENHNGNDNKTTTKPQSTDTIDKNGKNEKNEKNVQEIILYLNEKANKKFKPTTEAHKKYINARLKEGFTKEDCKTVIDKKVNEWKGTDMDQYLRPETLFRPSKFEGYLNQKNIKNNKKEFDERNDMPL